MDRLGNMNNKIIFNIGSQKKEYIKKKQFK